MIWLRGQCLLAVYRVNSMLSLELLLSTSVVSCVREDRLCVKMDCVYVVCASSLHICTRYVFIYLHRPVSPLLIMLSHHIRSQHTFTISSHCLPCSCSHIVFCSTCSIMMCVPSSSPLTTATLHLPSLPCHTATPSLSSPITSSNNSCPNPYDP